MKEPEKRHIPSPTEEAARIDFELEASLRVSHALERELAEKTREMDALYDKGELKNDDMFFGELVALQSRINGLGAHIAELRRQREKITAPLRKQ